MTTTAVSAAATQLALMPDFLDPIKLIGYFGTWALVGLLVVIFVESGVLFPVLPGDTLLFVAGMLAAGTAAAGHAEFQLWQLLVFIPDRRNPRRTGRVLHRPVRGYRDVQAGRAVPQAEVPR